MLNFSSLRRQLLNKLLKPFAFLFLLGGTIFAAYLYEGARSQRATGVVYADDRVRHDGGGILLVGWNQSTLVDRDGIEIWTWPCLGKLRDDNTFVCLAGKTNTYDADGKIRTYDANGKLASTFRDMTEFKSHHDL